MNAGSPGNGSAPQAGNQQVHGYRPELDAVRFMAFFCVFIHHFLLLSSSYMQSSLFANFAGQGAWSLRLAVGETGAMGLCLFFTLSAYLITSLLLKERAKYSTVSIRKFYVRRALRIWPLYFFGIALGMAIALIIHRPGDVTGFVWYLLFAGNFYCGIFGWIPNPLTPLWTISIEEQFYLLWPWAMRWFSRRGLFACAFVFIAVANITLFLLGQRHAETESKVWTSTFVQFQMFATGILLALSIKLAAMRNATLGSICVLAGPILWFVACFVFHAKQPAQAGTAISGPALIIGYALVALGCAAVLQGFCMIGASHIPRWAASLGKISYGLYVYHVLAIDFSQALFSSKQSPMYFAISALLALLLTIAAAVISYSFLETPFLRLKRRFEFVHSRPI